MVSLILTVLKGNPIKTGMIAIAIALLIGSSLGISKASKRFFKDYNQTKTENIALKSKVSTIEETLNNEKQILQSILERVDAVEDSRDIINQRILRSEGNIKAIRKDLGDIDIQTAPIDTSNTQVNLIWSNAIKCLEDASNGIENCDRGVQ